MSAAMHRLPICSICNKDIEVRDRKVKNNEKRFVHDACFKCTICEESLFVGKYTKDEQLSQQYGPNPVLLCFEHMKLGPAKRLEAMRAKFGSA